MPTVAASNIWHLPLGRFCWGDHRFTSSLLEFGGLKHCESHTPQLNSAVTLRKREGIYGNWKQGSKCISNFSKEIGHAPWVMAVQIEQGTECERTARWASLHLACWLPLAAGRIAGPKLCRWMEKPFECFWLLLKAHEWTWTILGL